MFDYAASCSSNGRKVARIPAAKQCHNNAFAMARLVSALAGEATVVMTALPWQGIRSGDVVVQLLGKAGLRLP